MVETKRACPNKRRNLQYIGWAAGITLTACATFAANAQMTNAPLRPKIIIAPTLNAQPSTSFELDIRIEGESALPQGTYLEIRGLPQLVTLSAGQALSRRSWSLPLDALANLKLQLPEQASGKSDLDLRLVTKSYVVVAFASTELIIGPAGAVTADPGKAEVERMAEATRQAEAERMAEAERKVEAERKAEAERVAEAARKAEAERIAEAERKAEAERIAEAARKAEAERIAEAARKAEAERIAEAERKAEAERVAEAERKAEAETAATQETAQAQETKQRTTNRESTPARNADEIAPGAVATNQGTGASSTPLQERREVAITAPPVQDANRAQAERLVGRGDQYLAQGNMAVARQYYLRAADLGDAHAAFKLAETYDPNEIERFNAIGIAANPAQARRWYQRAADLGAPDAERKLHRLGAP